MFIPIYNLAKFRNPTDLPKIAEVINNNDPKRIGRIKVRLEGLYEPEDAFGSNLPWIRKMSSSMGLSSDERNIPFIGDKVEIIWPYDNKHAFYRGLPYGQINNIAELDTYDWGWAMESGTAILINKNTGDFIIKTAGGSISGDSGGNIIIKGGNINIDGTTTIDGVSFLSHQHTNGNQGDNTGGVVST